MESVRATREVVSVLAGASCRTRRPRCRCTRWTRSKADKLALYDSVDDEVFLAYNEFALTSLVYYALKEGATSEQSSRMTAMDGASKNAGEMIDALTLTFNRTRQAVITRELIEIISGAAAV